MSLKLDDVKRITKLEIIPLIAPEKAILDKLNNLESTKGAMEQLIQDAAKQAELEAEAEVEIEIDLDEGELNLDASAELELELDIDIELPSKRGGKSKSGGKQRGKSGGDHANHGPAQHSPAHKAQSRQGHGGKGKSKLASWLAYHHGAEVLVPSELQHMVTALSNAQDDMKVLAIDCARNQGIPNDVYTLCEQAKDGRVLAPKYNSRMLRFKHQIKVIIFANTTPRMDAWSADRYDVRVLE